MKITLITVDKPRQSFIIDGVAEYVKRIRSFADFKIVHCKERDVVETVAHAIKRADLILLDEKGKDFTSKNFSLFLEKHTQTSRDLVFCIGGTDGHTQEMRKLPHTAMALSTLTLPHELALLLFTETLYRSLTISAGHPYHRE